jgi:peptidoglycan/xylan/chitin deacetylase (PgdA/CDA1 family)
VLVTFDDGYRGVLRWAAPILRRWRIPAVTFVCSEWSASRRRIWADGMTGQAARVDPESVKRKSIAEQRAFAERHGTASDDDPDALLSPNEVRQLHASGVEIGGHTGAHTVLAPGTLDEQRHEIEADKRRIEEWIGRRVRAFAYPNGRPGVDFDATTVKLVEEAGYEFAFSTNPSFAREEEGSFEYSRFVVFSSVTAAELVHRLAYGWRGSSIG